MVEKKEFIDINKSESDKTAKDGQPWSKYRRALSDRNWQEQCFLIDHIDMIIQEREKASTKATNYQNVIQIKSQEPDILTNLFSCRASGALYKATPHVLSYMVPMVKFSKIYYKADPAKYKKTQKRKINITPKGANFEGGDKPSKTRADPKADPISVPMELPTNTSEISIYKVMAEGMGRQDDVGLKSFSMNFDGTDIVLKDIFKCTGIFYFSSTEAFLAERTSTVGANRYVWSWQDLIRPSLIQGEGEGATEPQKKLGSSWFEIKAQVGWSPNSSQGPPTGAFSKRDEEAFDSLKNTTADLYLGLKHHTFEFKEDGSIQLTIVWIGRIQSQWNSKEYDLLYLDEGEDLEVTGMIEEFKETIESLRKQSKTANKKKKEKKAVKKARKGLHAPEASDPNATKEVGFNPSNESSVSKGQLAHAARRYSEGRADDEEVEILRDISQNQYDLFRYEWLVQKYRMRLRFKHYSRILNEIHKNLRKVGMIVVKKELVGDYGKEQMRQEQLNRLMRPAGSVTGTKTKEVAEEEKLKRARERAALSRTADLSENARRKLGMMSNMTFEDTNIYNEGGLDGSTTSVDILTKTTSAQEEYFSYEKEKEVYKGAKIDAMLSDPGQSRQSLIDEVAASHVENLADLLTQESAGDGTRAIKFIFLGDIIEAAYNVLKENPYWISAPNSDSEPQILLGPITYSDPADPGGQKVITANIADIPISLNYFSQWWIKNISSSEMDILPFHYFMRKLLEDLVLEAIGSSCYGGGQPFPVKSISVRPIILDKPLSEFLEDAKDLGWTENKGILNLDKMKDELGGQKFLCGAKPIKAHKKWYQYLLVYASNYIPRNLQGNLTEDKKKNIHHFFIGADTGLVKTISFAKMDSPSIHAYKLATDGTKSMREVYQAKIRMFGNTYFEPGQLIYINPTLVGLGNPKKSKSNARALGLGGYHRIIKVNSELSTGGFNTVLDAYWESFGAEEEDGTHKTAEELIDMPDAPIPGSAS